MLTPKTIFEDLKKYAVVDLWTRGNLRAVRIGYETLYRNAKPGGWLLLIVRDGPGDASVRTDLAQAKAMLREPYGSYYGFPETWGDASLLPRGILERLAAFEGYPDLKTCRGIVPSSMTPDVLEWMERGGPFPRSPDALDPQLLKLLFDDKSVVVNRGGLPFVEAVDRALSLDLLPWKGWTGSSYRLIEPRNVTILPVAEWNAEKHRAAPLLARPKDDEAPSARSQALYRDLLQQLRSSESVHPFPTAEKDVRQCLDAMRALARSQRVDAQSGTVRPTEKQIAYMHSIASRLGIPMFEPALLDATKAQQFIALHKPAFHRWHVRDKDGVDDDLTLIPPPARAFSTLADCLESYRLAASALGWSNGMPREQGRPLPRYRDAIRNAEIALRGNSLRGMPMELDIARKRVLGQKKKASIRTRAFMNGSTLLVSWSPADPDDASMWLSNSRIVDGSTVLLRYEEFSRTGAYPAADRNAPFNPAATLDAWTMLLVEATIKAVQARLAEHFELVSTGSFSLRPHPLDESELPLPWMWSLASAAEMNAADAEAIAAFEQGRMATPHGMDIAIVMAERGLSNLSAANWPTDANEAWKTVRHWMTDYRGLPDPDPAALKQEEIEKRIEREAASKAKAKIRQDLIKAHRSLADAVLDAVLPVPDLLEKARRILGTVRFPDAVIPFVLEVIPNAAIPDAFDRRRFCMEFVDREPIRTRAAKRAALAASSSKK